MSQSTLSVIIKDPAETDIIRLLISCSCAMPMPDLDIYVESAKHFKASNFYTLSHILPRLAEAGLSYRILETFNPGIPAKCAFVHVDLTDLPDEFRGITEVYPCAINGAATTINRTLYSKAILRQGDDFQGPVISKAILNHAGLPEFRYSRNSSYTARLRHHLNKLLNRNYKKTVCPSYETYRSIHDVPASIWLDSRLIVEKFLPGNLDLPITKYRCEFFMDCSLVTRSVFNSLLCSPEKVISVDVVDSIPSEVKRVRKLLKLDFGAIDYFMVDGQAFVIDANKTSSATVDWIDKYPGVANYIDDVANTLIAQLKQQKKT